ncbi:MAG: putative carboxypeptidase [Planctomycetota bacterium]|nr:putative carboxypeptidase [Planctomycetota bacterium]
MQRLRLLPLAFLVSTLTAKAADLPAPPPPADFTLVKWGAVVDYFHKADAASDRVVVRELGKTTEGRPYLAAFVSSAETIADLDRFKSLQRQIADPSLTSDPSKTLAESKAVVLITCSIHSSETASTFMAMKLLHELATGDDAETKEILDKTILILVPSANPDGVDIVADWYERTKGKPWEGDGLPWLYHKYAGHDTNRDWFMLNLKETQLLTKLLYKEWFPTLAYDVHQMGSRGARLFVPPFYDPINPNLDSRITQSIAIVGAHMAADLAANGKKGVLTHAMYDNWWNGGNRTTPQRHNIVAVLTEAASVKLASPIFLEKDQLRAATRGFTDYRPAVNFADPWPGGWWRLADIEQYERICARSILTFAARYKDRLQSDYRKMGVDAIQKGQTDPPFAWVVPAGSPDPGTAAEMVRILHDTGVKVHQAKTPLLAGGVTYPAGSWVMLAAQPYRPHLKDMMERQEYPPRFSATGEAEAPYDVAGWTLPLQMGVRAVPLGVKFEVKGLIPVEEVAKPAGAIVGDRGKAGMYAIDDRANDDFLVVNALHAAGVEVRRATTDAEWPGRGIEPRSLIFARDEAADKVLDSVLPKASTRVRAIGVSFEGDIKKHSSPVPPRKLGLYQPWDTSMDEGWTRLVLEKFHFPYVTLHNSEIRAGNLDERIDTLILPSIDAKTLREGYAPDATEPAYVGGLGREGLDAIRRFVQDGGTLVCLEDSCTYAIEDLGLGVTNVVKGLKTSEFYGPGSIVRVRHSPPTTDNSLTVGVPGDGSVYFDRSMAFEVGTGTQAAILSRYATTDVLQSGWLLGGARIQGKAALVDVSFEQGHVILFGFPPQHRGQPHGTFRLLFNALRR